MKNYQKQRIMTLIDPSADPQGSGYHTIQSMITVGSGGMTGKGYLHGTQTYLSYLPEHHTDFIFSQLAEEFGFAGGCLALTLFLMLFWRALYIARTASDPGGSLIAVGCLTLLAFHVFVNTSITIGILPVTGIPLPFFSYGGTFCLTTMMCIGVILSVNARRGAQGPPDAKPVVLKPARQGIS
jgi:rod shape determining protein RodA